MNSAFAVCNRQNYNDYGQYVTVGGGNYYQGSGAASLVSSHYTLDRWLIGRVGLAPGSTAIM